MGQEVREINLMMTGQSDMALDFPMDSQHDPLDQM